MHKAFIVGSRGFFISSAGTSSPAAASTRQGCTQHVRAIICFPFVDKYRRSGYPKNSDRRFENGKNKREREREEGFFVGI